MNLKNWIFISGVLFIISSCGETPADSTASANNSTANNTASNAAAVEVVPTAKTSFETKYPAASNVTWAYYEPYSDVDWEWVGWPILDPKDYTVRYNVDGADYYTWYDQDGNWVATVNPVTDYNGLPAAVNNTIKKQFDGYTITSVNKENDKDREAYEIKLEKGSDKMKALITTDGALLKKKGRVDGEKVKEKMDVK